jgi:hypothetical protein
MSAITPEVLRRDLDREDNNKNLNIRLKKVENNINYDNRTYNTTTNNTTINENKGFLRFVLEMVFFPVILIYKIIKAIIIKLDFKGNYKEYKRVNDIYDKRKRILKKAYKMQRLDDEIF